MKDTSFFGVLVRVPLGSGPRSEPNEGCYFNGLKSVSIKFSDHFKEIMKNKTQQPKVTIPMVALTSTSVYLLISSEFEPMD